MSTGFQKVGVLFGLSPNAPPFPQRLGSKQASQHYFRGRQSLRTPAAAMLEPMDARTLLSTARLTPQVTCVLHALCARPLLFLSTESPDTDKVQAPSHVVELQQGNNYFQSRSVALHPAPKSGVH